MDKPKWSLYMVRCSDGSLYTGIATDVDRRLEEHRSDPQRGAKYLRGRGPLELVFQRPVGDRSLASKLERHIKGLTKEEKEALVAGDLIDDIINAFSSFSSSHQ